MALAPGVVQIGAALAGALPALGPAPLVNFFVVTGQQHGRHGAALPDLGAGKLGVFQQAVPIALVLIALFLGQDAGLQAQDTVGHDQACQLTAGQHIVSDGNFLVAERIDDALVDALIVAADQRHRVIADQLAGLFLIVGAACGGQKDDVRLRAALRGTLGLHGAQAVGNRLGVEHHAAAAAVGVVVGLLLLVFRIVADLVAVRLKQIFGAGAAQDAGREKAVAQLRKKRYNVNAHRFSPRRR